MEAEGNIILMKPASRTTQTPDSPGKTYRTANGHESAPAEMLILAQNLYSSSDDELSESLFVDLLADEKGKNAALNKIKSEAGRRLVVNAITTNNLEKPKAVAGLKAILQQYHSGQIIRMRSMCDTAATEELSGKWLERYIIPIFVDIGIIIREGERSAYWQPHNLIGKTPSLLDAAKRLFELTPAQRELKQLADQAYAEQQKLNALKKRETLMEQQKQTYMRLTTQQQQLTELAGQHSTPSTLWGKAVANPGAMLMLGTLAAGVLLAAMGSAPVNDAPMPTLTAAMQAPAPTPDTAAVAALETANIRQQMEAAQ